MSYNEYQTQDRRLVILRTLTERPAYTINEYDLRRELAELRGHPVSRDALRADLAWLDEQGLLIAQQPGGAWIATLTARGEDVAGGLATVPGVARPRPVG